MVKIIHWINDNILVDDFEYDLDGYPIIPDSNFKWIDEYGIEHIMFPRDELPPLFEIKENIIHYFW